VHLADLAVVQNGPGLRDIFPVIFSHVCLLGPPPGSFGPTTLYKELSSSF